MGGLQYKDGPKQYGVRKSLFYYQPDQMPAGFYRSDLDWSSWTSWNKQHAERVDRSYDYPHVVAAYWVCIGWHAIIRAWSPIIRGIGI